MSFKIIITLPEYKKISQGVKRKRIKVKESEVEQTLQEIRKSRPKLRQVLRPAKIGDFVEIEFWGVSPPLPRERDAFLLGSGQLLPGFEEQIINLAPGQEKEFILCVPQSHYRKDLAGKEVKFRISLKQVQEVEFPELTDEFAKSLGKFESLADLKRSIKEGLSLEKELQESQRVREEILNLILKETKIEIPKELVERVKTRQLEELKEFVQNQFKIPFGNYLENIGKSEKELKNSLEESARKQIAFSIILSEIAKREGLTVSDQEVNDEIQKYLNKSHFRTPKEVQEKIDLDQLKSYTREMLIQQKVLEMLENLAQRE